MQMQFHFQDGRPKQKRHRCRNPNKIDVNSLTGEERVQIINRRNARKVCVCSVWFFLCCTSSNAFFKMAQKKPSYSPHL